VGICRHEDTLGSKKLPRYHLRDQKRQCKRARYSKPSHKVWMLLRKQTSCSYEYKAVGYKDECTNPQRRW